MNRFLETDAVYNEFFGRKDCLHIHIDYNDNKHCPEKAKFEAEICRAKNIEEYNHIWLGQPRKEGGVLNVITKLMYDALIGHEISRPIKKRLLTGDPSLGGDECVAYIINENGGKVAELFLHERDEMKIAALWAGFANQNQCKDFAIDVIGFKGIADRIRELIPNCNMIECRGADQSSRPEEYLNQRAEMYMYAAQQVMDKEVVYFSDDEMIRQLLDIRIKPLTSRKLKIEDKYDIRKRIGRSPDRADAYVQGIWALQFAKPTMFWVNHRPENYKREGQGQQKEEMSLVNF
jgi:hypothetical protein